MAGFEHKYPHLFSQITLGNTVFRNRIFASPTGWQNYEAGPIFPEAAAAYYGRKAQGGAASVAVGELYVDAKRGLGGPMSAQLDDPGITGSLTRLTDAITRNGAVAVAELQHAGMFAQESQRRGNQIYGPVDMEVHGEIAH
ncbi:MAG: 2-enoate reductase, partial [Oscillospiraceae bacterium]|nr:2-enoate reductase [Oscillospiraceae bacterium]